MTTAATLQIGGPLNPNIRTENAYLVQLKKSWADEWETRADIEAIRAEVHTAATGGSRAELARDYGPTILTPGATAYEARAALDILGYWVRIQLLTRGLPGTAQTIFTGQIESEARDIYGGTSGGASGRQSWAALGPERALEKIDLATSYWLDPHSSGAYELGWAPPFNLRDRYQRLTGNRSPSMRRPTGAVPAVPARYVFGGTDAWTHKDAIEYVLDRYVNRWNPTTGLCEGPEFRLEGWRGTLDTWTSRLALGASTTAARILAELIPTEYGLDYVIRPTAYGYAIRAFSMAKTGLSFGGYDFPANGQVWIYDAGSRPETAAEVEVTHAQRYDTVKVMGQRPVVALSAGASANGGTLVERWTATQQAAYLAGTGKGDDPPEKHDAYRATDRFRAVFQALAIDPARFTYQKGAANPVLKPDGTLAPNDPDNPPNYQVTLRATLDKLPLRAGYDYTTSPPTNNNAADTEPEFLPALAFGYIAAAKPIWAQLDKLDQYGRQPITVEPLEHEWGLLLNGNPNHALAKGHWANAKPSNFDPEAEGLDYTQVAVTIALQTDHRIAISSELPAGQRRGDASTKTVEVADAQLWALAPSTIVGIDAAGKLQYSPAALVLLRDDRDILLRTAAGLIARFQQPRGRATITTRTLDTRDQQLGTILTAVSSGAGNTVLVEAHVTSVFWDFLQRTTRFCAGAATR